MTKIIFTTLITIYLTGCVSTIETLDGLCFNEKDGTFVCDKPKEKENSLTRVGRI